jgi:MFS family permease
MTQPTQPLEPGTRVAAWLRSVGGLAAFRHRNYRLFFAGQGISLIGTWMTAVAQSWLVLQLTGNPFDLGVVAAFQFLPVLVLGLFGGLIADALPKRPTMYATQVVAMVVSFTLFALAVTNTVELWQVFVLAAVMGVRNAIDMPTRQAFAVEMVGREDVGNAVALNSAMFNGARILGPAIAGLTIGAFGVAVAFLVDALSFLAVLFGLFLMDEQQLHLSPRMARMTSVGAVVDNLVEGLVYVRRTSLTFLAIVLIGLVGTFGINFNIVIPPLAQSVLGVGASGYGFLMAASGIGSLLAALLIAFGGTKPARMLTGAFALGAAEVVIGGTRSYALDLVLMFLAGMGAISMMATANTVLQLAVPDALRGRVMAVYTTVFAGTTPIGGLLMGWIAATGGASAAILLGGLVSLLAAIAGFVWYRRLEAAGLTTDRMLRKPAQPGPAGAASADSKVAGTAGGFAQVRGGARR